MRAQEAFGKCSRTAFAFRARYMDDFEITSSLPKSTLYQPKMTEVLHCDPARQAILSCEDCWDGS